MAKKKNSKKPSKGKSSKGSKKFDLEELAGMAGGVYVGPMIDGFVPQSMNLDPKIIAGGKVFLGHYLKSGKIGGGGSLMKGLGTALQVEGLRQAMQEFGLIQGDTLEDDDELVVAIEGLDDEDPDDMGADLDAIAADDDIDSVSEDVLGEDVLGEDDEF